MMTSQQHILTMQQHKKKKGGIRIGSVILYLETIRVST